VKKFSFLAAVLMCVAGVAGAAMQDGLVAYYTFDSTLNDTSGSTTTHHGTYVGDTSASYAAAQFSNGIDLDGGTEHIQAADHADFDFGAGGTGMSISAWFTVNPPYDTSWQALVAKGEGNEFRLHRNNNGNGLNWSANGNVSAGYNVNDAALHHVVVTHDGAGSNSTKEIWVDGLSRGFVTNGGQIGDNNQPLMIGENPDAPGREWQGLVDDVGLWGRPLSDAEILALWNGGTGATIGSLLGPQPQPLFTITGDGQLNVEGFKLGAGGGATDTQLNNTTETLGIWNAIDGGATVPGAVSANSQTYNVTAWETDTENSVNYDGGNDFGGDLAWASINSDGPGGSGGGLGGEDFSVRAKAYLAVPIGTWSIAAGSDDGRRIEMPGLLGLTNSGFTAIGGQTGLGGVGQDVVGYNGTTGHNRTIGVFTVTAADVVPLTNYALLQLDSFYFERGSGDSFEISIKPGSDTSFGGQGEGWNLLADGTYGWYVSSTPLTVTTAVVPEPLTMLAIGLSAAGLGRYVRRRRKA